MALATVGHPISGFSGYVRAAGRGLFFSQGFTEAVDLTAAQKAALVAGGYTVDGQPDPPVADPFPQYLTEDEAATKTAGSGPLAVALRAASVAAVRAANVTFDIRDFGAKVDAIVLADATMTAGSAILTSASHSFVAGDVGKAIGVSGAGVVSTDYTANANDGVLVGTIASVSGGAATLSVAAVNTVAAATACFGTPDDAAFAAAQTAASAAKGVVFVPPGRTVVTQPLAILSNVEWAGVNREVSWVEVIMSAPASGSFEWLYKPDSNRRQAIHLRDFAVEARYHIRPSGYSTSLKPLNIWGVDRASIRNMQLRNFPATAIPFDGCRDGVLIAYNLIVNPGRLNGGNAGGSGIGIGVSRNSVPISYLIIGNTVLGTGSPTTDPRGNNGIFIEAQDGTGATPAGVRVIGNYVQGMRHGISDNGGGQMVIADNVVIDCYEGISVARGGVGGSYAGEGTLVRGNVIRGWAPGTNVSKGILVYASVAGDLGNARIIDNTITGRTGRGIMVLADTGITLDGLEIRGNRIKDVTLSGIWIDNVGTGAIGDLAIIGNDVDNVGTSDTAADDSGIRLSCAIARLTLTGNIVNAPFGSGLVIGDPVTAGQITGNDVGTFGGAGVIDPNVRIFGNIGWNASLPTITGSRGGNAALTSLITGLAAKKIIIDSTTA